MFSYFLLKFYTQTYDFLVILILWFVFHSQAGYSSPIQSAITKDINLSIAEVSW